MTTHTHADIARYRRAGMGGESTRPFHHNSKVLSNTVSAQMNSLTNTRPVFGSGPGFDPGSLLVAQPNPYETKLRATNGKVIFHEQVKHALINIGQSNVFHEQLIMRSSMYGHFPHDGLASGRMCETII